MKFIRSRFFRNFIVIPALYVVIMTVLPVTADAQWSQWRQEELNRQNYQRQQWLQWQRDQQTRQAIDRQQQLQWQQQERIRQMFQR